ncbi:MAG: transcription elongation factor GreA [Treponema sp.]|nr:transcription elongation factor GreA [Treponema sp.]
MADNLIQSVQDMLKEETWTRATISGYTQNDLKELADVYSKAKEQNCISEIYTICEEHLSHTKDSIIALFFHGIISLQENSIDNSSLETLVDIFQKNHKEAIVSYLCEFILDDNPENLFALRTLANTYLQDNNEKVWELYTQIVNLDKTEADLAKTLAEHLEAAGDTNNAYNYYKKAILRYNKLGNYNGVKEIWTKLVQINPEKNDFFKLTCQKIAKQFGDLKTTTLMQELYDWNKANGRWDMAISILKRNLEIEPKDTWARKELTDCYRNKYSNHSHLEDYIKSSNLTQNYRNVFEAINDFEKHIAFDKGTFVFHQKWGVGIIRKLEHDILTINFGKKKGIHEIALKMAVTALKPLANDHIWVIKARCTDLKALKKDVKDNPAKYLKIIIQSYDNHCDLKRIKSELVDQILTAGEWTSWSNAAKKILENDNMFSVDSNNINCYTVHENELSSEEKHFNEFEAQKEFFPRVDILMKYVKEVQDDEGPDLTSEDFNDKMYNYFTNRLKNIQNVDEYVIASYLIVRKLSAIEKQIAYPVKETFAELYGRLEDPRKTYDALKDTKNTTLKKDFIECIKMLPDWHTQYLRLFPNILDGGIIKTLIENGFTEDVQKFVRTSFTYYKDYKETVLFFFENCKDEEWFINAGIPTEKQLITLINIIDLTFKKINAHVDSTENKKLNKKATELLFDKEYLYDYIFNKDEDTVKKFYTMIDDIIDIDPSYKEKTRHKISEKYPNFKFPTSSEKSSKSTGGMIVTAAKLEEKKAELDRIQNVELPANAKDVADARAKGDLKENAEYKAAREQQHMLNLSLAKLQEELNRATVFDPTTVSASTISFGTEVTLHNNKTNEDETYTILGPWESDPEKNIISYMSPFGNAILERTVNEEMTFKVNDKEYDYTVKNIKKASL